MAQSSFQGFLSPRPDKKGGGSIVKSVQRGEITIISSASLVDVTISPVDITKAIPRITSINTANPATNATCVKAKITSGTNLQLQRGGATADVVTITWQVIEYYAVTSLQSGTFAKTTGSASTSITAVNLAKAELIFSHTNDSVTTGNQAGSTTGKLASATSITFVDSGDPGNRSVDWYVIEYS